MVEDGSGTIFFPAMYWLLQKITRLLWHFPRKRKAAVEGVNDISFFGWLIIALLDRLLFSTEMFNINNYSPVINKVCTAAILFLFAIVHRELGENDHRCHSSLGSSELMGHLIIYNPYYYNNYCYCIGEPAALLGEESNKSIACSNTAYNATIPTFPLLLTV